VRHPGGSRPLSLLDVVVTQIDQSGERGEVGRPDVDRARPAPDPGQLRRYLVWRLAEVRRLALGVREANRVMVENKKQLAALYL
jgi:hypothetical protein